MSSATAYTLIVGLKAALPPTACLRNGGVTCKFKVLSSFNVWFSGTGRGFGSPPLRKHKRCGQCRDRQRMRIRIIFLVTLVLASCGDLVRFEEPQPAGQSNEKRIPKRLIGQYLSLDDSAKLIIADGLIIKYSITDFSDKMDTVDMKSINGDTTYSGTEDKLKFDVVVKGDSTNNVYKT
jgi:hypothetical protein